MAFSRLSRLSILAAGIVFSSLSLHAAPPSLIVLAEVDTITVQNAWARATPGAATTAAAYVTLMGGAQPDQLISVSTPVAATAEVHQTLTENGVMKMRPAPNLPIPAAKMVTFAPGGTHIMLMGLKQPLIAGQNFPMTLTFAHATPVMVEVKVQAIHGSSMGSSDHMKMQ